MIEIKHLQISDIPALELFKKGNEHSKLPLIVFYHGWESRKERVLEQAYILARYGFRVVLPEAINHGERKSDKDRKLNPLDFWEHIQINIEEFPSIVEHYKKNQIIDLNNISVAGLSFGGVTTSALLTQYEWIHSAAVLMGTPAPKEFSLWVLKNHAQDGIQAYDMIDKEVIINKLNQLAPISLNLNPDKIANRPVYFWHGKSDPIVPFHITQSFIEKIKNEPYSQNVRFEASENIGHEVPQDISIQMAKFLEDHLNITNESNILF